MYIYIYIYAVELFSGPIFTRFMLKRSFFVFFYFLFLKISFSLQKEDGFQEETKTKKMTKKDV